MCRAPRKKRKWICTRNSIPGYHACQTTSKSDKSTDFCENKDSPALLVVQIIDVAHEFLDRTASRTVIPFTTVPDASHFACESDSTRLCDVVFLTSLDTRSEQIYAFALIADARIELGEIETMFHGAFLDQISIGDVGVIGNHAIGESEPEFDIGVCFGCTEEDDVSQAFARTMHARDGVGIRIDTSNK